MIPSTHARRVGSLCDHIVALPLHREMASLWNRWCVDTEGITNAGISRVRLFLHVTCIYDYVILCYCTLAAALYFEQSSCDELMEFKQIQTRAQPEESLKHNRSCTHGGHHHCFFTPVTGLCNYGYVLMIPRAVPSFESV